MHTCSYLFNHVKILYILLDLHVVDKGIYQWYIPLSSTMYILMWVTKYIYSLVQGFAILNPVSDLVFVDFESGFFNGKSGFSQRRVRIFYESVFSFSPGFLRVRVRVRVPSLAGYQIASAIFKSCSENW